MGQILGFSEEHSSLVENFLNLVLDIYNTSFNWYLMIYFRWVFTLNIMIVFLTPFTMICSNYIWIDIPKMSMMIIESLFTNCHF